MFYSMYNSYYGHGNVKKSTDILRERTAYISDEGFAHSAHGMVGKPTFNPSEHNLECANGRWDRARHIRDNYGHKYVRDTNVPDFHWFNQNVYVHPQYKKYLGFGALLSTGVQSGDTAPRAV